VKNATNRDTQSVAYWQTQMEYAVEPEFGDLTEVQFSTRRIPEGLSEKQYNLLLNKKPISHTKKDWAKVNDSRTSRYASLDEDDVPAIDIFALGEYGKLNLAYLYFVRNYDKYSFDIIGKHKVIPEKRTMIREETADYEKNGGKTTRSEDAPDGTERGNHVGGSERTGNRTELRTDDHRDGTDERSFQRSDLTGGISDSESGLSVDGSQFSHRRDKPLTDREILSQIDPSKRNETERYFLGQYQDRLKEISEEEPRLAAIKKQMESLDPKKDKAKLSELRIEAGKIQRNVTYLKKKVRESEGFDMFKRMAKEERNNRSVQKYKEEQKQKIYCDNYMRFLSGGNIDHVSPHINK
jgi:hypothetical protein